MTYDYMSVTGRTALNLKTLGNLPNKEHESELSHIILRSYKLWTQQHTKNKQM